VCAFSRALSITTDTWARECTFTTRVRPNENAFATRTRDTESVLSVCELLLMLPVGSVVRRKRTSVGLPNGLCVERKKKRASYTYVRGTKKRCVSNVRFETDFDDHSSRSVNVGFGFLCVFSAGRAGGNTTKTIRDSPAMETVGSAWTYSPGAGDHVYDTRREKNETREQTGGNTAVTKYFVTLLRSEPFSRGLR